MTDSEAAAAAYTNAMEAAKAEFDSLKPEFDRIIARINHLRRLIIAAAALTGVELDDRYQFPSITVHAQRGAHVHSVQGKKGR